MAVQNYRLINVDAHDPDSPSNFDISSLVTPSDPVDASHLQELAGRIRQQSRGGDAEGALKLALQNAPYGSDARAKALHLGTVLEVLQTTKQAGMTSILTHIYQSPGGSELLDTLMKYLYEGMARSGHGASSKSTASPQHTGFSQVHSRAGLEGSGSGASVLLSWHEKLLEVAGPGSIMRAMTDRRTVG